jgi:hypothetical protein
MSETNESQPTPEAPAASPANLNIGDLVLSAQIVQRAASAGVFKAEELKVVGDYYDRLVTFLESSGAITRKPAGQESSPDPTPEPSGE